MGYLIAYLLLALAIDLLRELITPDDPRRNTAAIRRRLWSDTDFDCCSKVFVAKGNVSRQPTRMLKMRGRTPWKKRWSWFVGAC